MKLYREDAIGLACLLGVLMGTFYRFVDDWRSPIQWLLLLIAALLFGLIIFSKPKEETK